MKITTFLSFLFSSYLLFFVLPFKSFSSILRTSISIIKFCKITTCSKKNRQHPKAQTTTTTTTTKQNESSLLNETMAKAIQHFIVRKRKHFRWDICLLMSCWFVYDSQAIATRSNWFGLKCSWWWHLFLDVQWKHVLNVFAAQWHNMWFSERPPMKHFICSRAEIRVVNFRKCFNCVAKYNSGKRSHSGTPTSIH